MTRIVCTADLHENTDRDSRLRPARIAGDISFAFKGDHVAKQAFLAGPFKKWLDEVPAAEVVLVAGNHDQSIEAWGLPDGLRCHYLEDASTELFGLRIWGTPWQPWFHGWAFNAPRRHGERFLASKFDLIPAGTELLICQGPRAASGITPVAQTDNLTSARRLTEAIERIQPRLMVCAGTSTPDTAGIGSARPRSSMPRTSTTTTGRPTPSSRSPCDADAGEPCRGLGAAGAPRARARPATTSSSGSALPYSWGAAPE